MSKRHARLKRLRERLFVAQGGRCFYCERRCVLGGPNKWRATATLDHIIPKSKGGTNEQSNFVVACRACNYCKAANMKEAG